MQAAWPPAERDLRSSQLLDCTLAPMDTLSTPPATAPARNPLPAPRQRAGELLQRLPRWWLEPRALLGLLCVCSLGARLFRLSAPQSSQSGKGSLIFDELYYVNAARVFLGIAVPCHDDHCEPFSTNPAGTDPNSEHPPLGKLLVAAGMRVFGDAPLGWRVFPVIFGTLAILAVYWLVRSAGGGSWLALGASSLMAVDNLALVHGRIATLDVFVVVFMLAAAALYLRGHPLIAGAVLGVGACTKLVAPFLLLVLLIFEGIRILVRQEWRGPRGWRLPAARLIPLAGCTAVFAVVYIGLLDILDILVSPYHNPGDAGCPGSGSSFSNSIVHTRFMLCYAGKLTSPDGPRGIASYPWQWFLNQEPITYFRVDSNITIGNQTIAHPLVWFQGVMNPAIILLALPALAVAAHSAWRERDDLSAFVLAWTVGTFLPFFYSSWRNERTSYLYYMLIVLPAIYIAVARLFSRRYLPRPALLGYVCILGYEFWSLYPFRTWSS
jgi:dolichyl-phosphate-mannose--protein O-mannosyl transferase